MDAGKNIIPIVEGDQDEGFMDEIDDSLFQKLAEEQTQLADKPLLGARPKPMKMQLGMPINFHGYQYKVTKMLSRGRLVLKLLGKIPEGR